LTWLKDYCVMRGTCRIRERVGQEQVDAPAQQVAAPQRRGQVLCGPEHPRAVIWIEIGQPDGMPARHDQQVAGHHRPDVHEGDDVLVGVHDARLGGAGHDRAGTHAAPTDTAE